MNIDTPIYSALLKHKQLDLSSFHTPGHKSGDFLPKDLLSLDFTELPDTDELYNANGIILEAEKNIARLFNTKRSLISSGGCTLAIQAMIKIAMDFSGSVKGKKKNKMLFARNSHRAAVNTMALLGIEPIWLIPRHDEPALFGGRIMPEDVEDAVIKNPDVCSCFITSPNYYGEISDIKAISEVCRKYNILLLVDNAHGSHLAFLNENLHPIHLGADMSACSLHKTLPVLTGGAVLNINNENLLKNEYNPKDAMALFGSTSPSYPIMASIDLCTAYLLNGGGASYKALEHRISKIKDTALERNIPIPNGICDKLRICLNTASIGLSGVEQVKYFHSRKIEPEFCDGQNSVFICTPFNSEKDFIRLENAIKSMPQRPNVSKKCEPISTPKFGMSVREAVLSESITVSAENAVGHIACGFECPCPPGIPSIIPGEKIGADICPKDKKIKIVKE